jgi:hypothetical protein
LRIHWGLVTMKRTMLFLPVLLLVASTANADLHLYSKVKTANGDNINVEQWISGEKSTRRIGQQVYVIDLEKKSLALVDHDQRTVAWFDLMDPKPLGAFNFVIEPTDRFDTLGDWKIEEFHVTNPDRPQIEYFVWTTRDHKVNVQPYYNLVRRLPSGDDFMAALKETYGFPVKIVTVIQGDSGQETTTSTTILLENVEAPDGVYAIPKGYSTAE